MSEEKDRIVEDTIEEFNPAFMMALLLISAVPEPSGNHESRINPGKAPRKILASMLVNKK